MDTVYRGLGFIYLFILGLTIYVYWSQRAPLHWMCWMYMLLVYSKGKKAVCTGMPVII